MSAYPDTPLLPPPPPPKKGDDHFFLKFAKFNLTAVIVAIIVFRILPYLNRAEIQSDGSTWYATRWHAYAASSSPPTGNSATNVTIRVDRVTTKLFGSDLALNFDLVQEWEDKRLAVVQEDGIRTKSADITTKNVESIVNQRHGKFTPIWKPSLATVPPHVADKSNETTWLRQDGGVMRTQSINIVAAPAPGSGPFNETDSVHYVVKIYSTREFQSRVALQWNISEPFRFISPNPENLTYSNPWRVDITTGQCDMHVNWGDFLLTKLSCLEMGFKLRRVQKPEVKIPDNLNTNSTVLELLFAAYGTILCIISFHVYRVYSRAEFLP